MKYPKISVVTPSYNQARFIRSTIDSVLSQDYPNLEYIVVDGGSTDDTVDILKSYGKKIKWVSEKDAGQTDAINKGLCQSTGELLAYLNSDDLYLPGTLKKIGEYYVQTGADWITGDYQIIDAAGRRHPHQTLVSVYKSFLLRHYSPRTLRMFNSYIPQPSTFWSRAAYKFIGEFETKLRYTMDYDYWLRLSAKYPLHYLPVALSAFRRHATSKSDTGTAAQFAEELSVARAHGATLSELTIHRLHSLVTSTLYGLYGK